MDIPPDATRLESPASAGEPDPFATWFAPDPPARPAPPGRPASPPNDSWQTADTMYAAPAPAPPGPGYPPPNQPRGPVYGGPPRQPSRGPRAALVIAVVLVVLAAGGAAYAFIARSHKTAAAGPSATASASASAPAGAHRTGQASASASASAKGSASPSPSLVAIASGVAANPAAPQVETVLSHFFGGINAHDYTEYTSALDARERSKQSRASFDTGYASTSDSGMTLTSLTSTAGGGLAATVTFTSHQDPSASVDHSGCNSWTLTLYLVPDGQRYLDGAAPSGYQPTYADC